jgi:carboxypeptidase Taq
VSDHYTRLTRRLRETTTLGSVAELLGWDQETMMPRSAARFRAEELAVISSLVHQKSTDTDVGDLIATCEADATLAADPTTAANLRDIRRDYDRARLLPTELVAEISETSSLAMEAWKLARENNAFSDFAPWLQKQLTLQRRKAECYGAPAGGELYDALVEDYEPGMRSADIERLFGPLREGLQPLIAEIAAATDRIAQTLERIPLPPARQHVFNHTVLTQIGFDLTAGRIDVSTHPFSAGLGPGDTRITTRYRDDGFLDSLGSTMHEAGHGLYEQGLPKAERLGQPAAEALSLGWHESQSRLWENQVGRSRAFWAWAGPVARGIFGDAVSQFTDEDFYRAVNIVRPNLIRVESDEATYNLHIMLRFDLERAMLRGDLTVADLPGAWNDRIARDFGLDVPDDTRGCLQDVHWSIGSIGYFPTYTLGNLYSAQLWDAVVAAIPDIDQQMQGGDFSALLGWLRSNVHIHGRRFPATELSARVTGHPLESTSLLCYLKTKLRPLYNL